MGLADTVKQEQAEVAAGSKPACGAAHPFNVTVSDCVRAQHLPADTTHVGEAADLLIQWPEGTP